MATELCKDDKGRLRLQLFSRKERFLGIDISPSAIKLMELSQSGQRIQIEALAREPLPEDAMVERNPAALDQVSAALKRALKNSGTTLKKAAVAVPSSSVITRTIPMPIEYSEDDIELNIQVEAAQYIPFPLEEIHLDFQVLGASRGSDAMQDVMIVASRRENVDLREEVLSEAGLKAAVVDVEAYSLENTYPFITQGAVAVDSAVDHGTDTRTALVDIGASITTLYVFQGDKVIFTREQNYGGDQLTRTITDTYDLPKDRAELAKHTGDLSEDYPLMVLEPYKQSLAEQIDNALQFFYTSSHFNSIDHVVLSGGGAMLPGLDQTVSSVLSLPVTIGNPFVGMNSTKKVNRRSLDHDAPLFIVAFGLALRSLDS